MKYAFTLILGFFYSFSYGQFSSENTIIADYFPDYFTLGDIDSDGDTDVFTTFSSSSPEMGWLENVEEGKFRPIKFLDNPVGGANAIEVSDLNNDGISDLIFTTSANMTIFYGTGNGAFENPKEVYGAQSRKLKISDLDGDGNTDLVAITNSGLIWLANSGDTITNDFQLIFEEASSFSAKYEIFDADGDGDKDVVTITNDMVILHENTGVEFSIIDTLLIGASNLIEMKVSDIDEDNDTDILVLTTNPIGIYIFENENSELLDAQLFTEDIGNGYGFDIDDLDGDGDDDFLVYNGFNTGTSWLENLDNSTDFGALVSLSNDIGEAAKLVDIDLDGDNDFVTFRGNSGGTISWFENENLTFPKYENIIHKIRINSVDGADFDGDGDIDLAASSPGFNVGVHWLENLGGTGEFSATKDLYLDNSTNEPNIVKARDFDLDGDMDLFAGLNGEGVIYYENLDGLGNFGSAIEVNSYSNDFVSFNDVDGDGDMDILSKHSQPHRLLWFENVDGSFLEHTISTDVVFVSRTQFEDLDGDGDRDIIVFQTSDNALFWFANQNGNFSSKMPITSDIETVNSIEVGDINNDGFADLVVSTFVDIAWYPGLGNQVQYGDKQFIAAPDDYPRNLQLVDIDANGSLDILTGEGGFESVVRLYLNDNGTFEEEQEISTYGTFVNQFVNAIDVDNDGSLDILAGTLDEVVWHKNYFNALKIKGTTFFDENENGTFDNGETGLLNQITTLDPNAITNWTNGNGQFNFVVSPATYELSCQPVGAWEFTTNASETLTVIDDAITQNFGLKPVQIISEASLSITSAPTRCGFIVPFWLDYQNTGTTQNNGVITLELDDLVEFQSANPAPSQINGNTLIWDFTDLNPTYSNQIYLDLQMPGVMNIGENIELTANILLTDDNGNDVFSTDYEYTSTINCAYDPNDKQVTPPGVFAENLTLFDEEFEYTIRFQNTGTDTAFTVRLEDQLDTDLDWSTFQPIAASHPYSVTLTEGGLVEFLFENILLPDSTTNEVASHGFAKYRIQPLTDLEENTEILNTANIFFDFNPPIQTNTTLNTMVSEITSVEEVLAEVEMDVSPNPFEEEVQFQIGELPFSKEAILTVFDVNGQRLQQFAVAANSTIAFNGKNLPAGIYFYQLAMDGNHLKSGKLVKKN